MKRIIYPILLASLCFGLSDFQTGCVKTNLKIIQDTVFINHTTSDTIILWKITKDTITKNYTDTLRDTLYLGADINLPPDINTFLNTNKNIYNQWFNYMQNYYDGYTLSTIHMDAIAVFYGPISIDPMNKDTTTNKLIFAGFYQNRIFATTDYNINTLQKTDEILMTSTSQYNSPGLKLPDGFLTKNQLVDAWGSTTAFIVRR